METETMNANLKYEEVKGDLFSCPGDCSLVHCVSEDLHMGKGIALLFKQKFGGVEELKKQNCKVGEMAILSRAKANSSNNIFIYYLITKQKYYQKPTYTQLKSCLLTLREHCLKNNVTRLAMPKIGCGLDKLNWNDVSKMLKEVFHSSNISITVYYV